MTYTGGLNCYDSEILEVMIQASCILLVPGGQGMHIESLETSTWKIKNEMKVQNYDGY